MDPNLLYWKTEGQSFFSRLQTWFSLLNPSLLLASEPEIQNAHARLGTAKDLGQEDGASVILSLSSVHPDSGANLPLAFRPPAVFPFSSPLVLGNLLPHVKVRPALFWQFLQQSYYTGFNYANRNSSSEESPKISLSQLVLMAGTVSFTTCAGAFPWMITKQLSIQSPPVLTFCRSIMPIPLSAALAFFNVFTVRYGELDSGVQVFDERGHLVGVSKAAARQAVTDTALSRAALFGMTAAVPNLLVLLLKRTRLFQRNLVQAATVRHASGLLFLGLMLPVSFSLFPPVGTINGEKLEAELRAEAAGGHLFYHRGL